MSENQYPPPTMPEGAATGEPLTPSMEKESKQRARSLLADSLEEAILVKIKMLKSGHQKTQDAAATFIIEHVLGRPKQTLDIATDEESFAAQLFAALAKVETPTAAQLEGELRGTTDEEGTYVIDQRVNDGGGNSEVSSELLVLGNDLREGSGPGPGEGDNTV